MTAPSGGITLGVTIDASDIRTQLNTAVRAAMADVQTVVRRGVDDMESQFSQIDVSGFSQITREIAQVSTQLSRIDTTALRDAGQEASRFANELRGIDDRTIQQLVARVGTLENELASARQEVTRLGSETQQTGRDMRQAGDDGERAGGRIGSAFKSAGTSLAGVGAGVIGIGTIAAGLADTIEHANISNRLKAQLDLTTEQSEQAGKIAGHLYIDAYGESLGEVTSAVGDVSAGLARLGTEGADQIEALTKNAIDFNQTFGIESAESVQVVAQLIQNQLVKNGTEGFDLLFASFQRVPAAMREEIPDLINEYGTFFKSIGLDGPEAFGVIVGASAQGAIAMDKMGDAIKEVGIRATDIGDTGAVEALKEIGLEGANIQERLLAGGNTAKDAFHQMTAALLGVPDSAKQAAAAVALFGTPIEDLDKTQIAGFLEAMNHAGEAMEGFEGSASRAGEAINASPNAALITFKRNVEESVVHTLGRAIEIMKENENATKALGYAIAAAAAAYVTLRVAGAVGAVIEGVRLAMAGAAIAADASALSTGGYVIALAAQKIALLATAAASGIATAATWALNAAMAVLTSPITLIVAAIALVVGALVLFFTKTELGKQVFATLKDAVLAAWSGIQTAITATWAFLQPIFQAIWSFVTDTLAPAFVNIWHTIEGAFAAIGGIISFWWTGIAQPIFSAVIGFIVGSLWPAIQAFVADVVQAFHAWSDVVTWLWSVTVQPIFNFIVALIQNVVAPAISWLWSGVVMPAFHGIGDIIAGVWNGVIAPTFDLFKQAISLVGDAISGWWTSIVQPTFSLVGDLISGVINNVITPAWEVLKQGLSSTGEFFSATVRGIESVWNGLKSILAKPINFLIGTVYNGGIVKAWNAIEKFIPGIDAAPEIGLIPEAWTGGRIRGPKGKDNVLMWGSDEEHMLTVSDVDKAGGHNIIYTIRDMIQRGIPFTWDNGKVIDTIGRANMERYGAAVKAVGVGNVDPQGMFDELLPRFYRGGEITEEPWMKQLMAGHEFAMAQSGKPYQWAGPTGVGSSFDCSGFMGSIAAAITGGNPWQRYFSTASFAGYPAVGPMGFTKGTDAGFSIGVTDDPGGAGGGHTAGVLGAAGRFIVARVESGGALGNVHYGAGTDIGSFAAQYHLPIGANGFFDAGSGAGSGPSPESMMDFLKTKVKDTFDVILNPIKDGIASAIGAPPPQWFDIPPKFLDHSRDVVVDGAFNIIGGLGDLVGQAWSKAVDVGRNVLDFVNPFDSGGVATGTGMLAKNTIEPERVLSPEQTRLFDALVSSLQTIAGSPSAAVPNLLTADIFQQGVDFLSKTLIGMSEKAAAAAAIPQTVSPDPAQTTAIQTAIDEVGRIATTTQDLVLRTSTSAELSGEVQAQQIQAGLDQLTSMLTDQALIPIMQSAVSEGIGILRKWLDAGADQVTAGTDRTTAAVQSAGGAGGAGASAPFGAPGSSFDALKAVSDAIVGVANTASQAFTQVSNSIAQAALAQTPSRANPSKGRLGTDISGGSFVDMIVRLTGVEIEIRDTLTDTLEQVVKFRGDLHKAFDESGRIVGDTAELMQRNESSRELVISETERINRALIKAVLKYLILNVLLPIIQAILGAMITLATTAIGAAIGSFIPIIGTVIGAAIGAVIGAALAGLAAVFVSSLAVGAGAALDAFDTGGIAMGTGFMPKNTIAPERVLSPRQTDSFDRLVDVLDRAEHGRNVTINAPFTVVGGQGAGRTAHNDLLSLLSN